MTRQLAGDTPQDVALWNSYLYWARERVLEAGLGEATADAPENRLAPELATAIQAILFAALALEYRLRRASDVLGAKQGRTLSPLLEGFWREVGRCDRLDGNGKCVQPPEWDHKSCST